MSPSAHETVTSRPSASSLVADAGADHGGDAELAGDDRGVAGAAAAVGDDRRGPLHDRLPVGVGHVGDQHLARVELVHLVDGGEHPHRAGADLLPDRAPLDEHLAALSRSSWYRCSAGAAARDCTVSGRACRM